MAAMAPECPPGYRLLQPHDLAVGKQVLYISRDPSSPHTRTQIIDTTIKNDTINLKCRKDGAPMKRVFVEETAAVATEAKGPNEAAVGAAAAAAVGDTATVSAGAALADTDKFLRNEVVGWISSLEAESSSLPEALDAALARLGKTPEDMVQAFKGKVPWLPCVNFQAVPKCSKKGTLHISMLSYRPWSYAGNGMFVGDAKLLLETEGFAGLDLKTLAVKPHAGASMTCFGWEPDGSVVNSTYAFAMSCIVAYCVCNDCSMPQPLAQLLQSIPVRFTKHETSQSRLLQSLIDSAVQRHANRTVQCPIFLAEELNRCTFQTQYVKSFVKLYQQRMALKPALQLPPRSEDCVIRIMTQTKTCAKAMKSLTQAVVKFTWHDGPWVVGHIMSSFFPIGANLNSSTHEQWAQLNVQSALGQTMALEIGNAIFEASNKKLDCEDGWSVILVACGLWVQVKDKLIPSLLMGSAAVGALDQALQNDSGFRSDLAAASTKEPPVNMSGLSDLAGWLMTQVSALRRAKQAAVAAVGASGETPSKLLGDKEASDLAAFNYVSGCMLDVTTYRQAMEKFGEDAEVHEKQWRTLQEKYVGNLTRLHTAMQQSDVVYWEPPQRVGMKKNKTWLAKAVTASVAHRRNLKTILGVKDSDICQVNVFALYALGTAKKNTLEAIAQTLDKLPGLTLVFFPVIPKKLKRMTIAEGSASAAAVGAGDAEDAASQSNSDSDVDADAHDFTADGVLPEALTSLHTVKTASERAAQLASDCHLVSSIVGMADISSRYPKSLHFLHQADAAGDCSTTSAMLLVPTHEVPGVNMASLAESQALRSGSYTDVPVPAEWIKVSRKFAMQSKRAMGEQGMLDTSTRDAAAVGATGVRYALNKVARAQLGTGLHQVWIQDIIKHCGAKALFVCLFVCL